jgi:hypothetical protein
MIPPESPDLFSDALLDAMVAKLAPRLIAYINQRLKPLEKMLLSINTAAYVMDTTPAGVEWMVRTGQLPAVRHGKKGRRIAVSAIQGYIDTHSYRVSAAGRELAKKLKEK